MQEAIPQIFSGKELTKIIEAILMVVPEPVASVDIANALNIADDQVEVALTQLRAEYDRDERGFELREVGGGWRYYSRPSYDPFVSQFVSGSRMQNLSQAALETLAVIAYRNLWRNNEERSSRRFGNPPAKSYLASRRGISPSRGNPHHLGSRSRGRQSGAEARHQG